MTKHDSSKPMACRKSSSKKEVYSNTILPQETRKTLNRQPKFTPKRTGRNQKRNQNMHRNKNKSKNIQMELGQTFKLLHSKENHK